MTELWIWVLGACAIAYLTKLSGFLVPDSLLERLWLRSLGGGVFAALRGGLVAAITQDWLQVGVAV